MGTGEWARGGAAGRGYRAPGCIRITTPDLRQRLPRGSRRRRFRNPRVPAPGPTEPETCPGTGHVVRGPRGLFSRFSPGVLSSSLWCARCQGAVDPIMSASRVCAHSGMAGGISREKTCPSQTSPWVLRVPNSSSEGSLASSSLGKTLGGGSDQAPPARGPRSRCPAASPVDWLLSYTSSRRIASRSWRVQWFMNMMLCMLARVTKMGSCCLHRWWR